MSFGAWAYGVATRLLAPFVPILLSRRARLGKDDPARLNERLSKDLPARPAGRLVWMHGASVGESQILLGLSEKMSARAKDLFFLFTSQTLTSAQLVAGRGSPRTLHQMAPVDTPGGARRFIAHWKPDLAVFAEGEIWPNLIQVTKRSKCSMALVNARMTQNSRSSWARWPGFSRRLFGAFDLVLPADEDTRNSIARLSGKSIPSPINLKRGLPPPPADQALIDSFRATFLRGRKCLLAASTHEGEEDLFLDACSQLPDNTALIIAPRHPDRGEHVGEVLASRGLSFARRSQAEDANSDMRVLLADTIGEMGVWYRLADAVFLGGASKPDIGGHNPIEPLQLQRPTITGPHGHNFEDLFDQLKQDGLLEIATSTEDLSTWFRTVLDGTTQLDPAALDAFRENASQPLEDAATSLLALIPDEVSQ
ncbi:MAG: glycosyltransferase N-terminal domain-containing protein [Pseudomonadota bacterium]